MVDVAHTFINLEILTDYIGAEFLRFSDTDRGDRGRHVI
jgi:hypothetical protein